MYKPVITATLSLNKKEDKSVKMMLFKSTSYLFTKVL